MSVEPSELEEVTSKIVNGGDDTIGVIERQ